MSGPRVWVDENDLRVVVEAVEACGTFCAHEMCEAGKRLKEQLDPPPPPPLRPYIPCTQGHGA